MTGGIKAALLMSFVALGGCASGVTVRAIADPSAALSRGGDELAAARGQFMLGNVGLALEGFRKAQRAYPSDPRPLAGIGDCYARMGRFDLAQESYEAALALAPRDRSLLFSLASIFDEEGQPERAARARAEANGLSPLASGLAAPAAAGPDPAGLMARVAADQEIPRGTITVELPPARPADRLADEAGRRAPPLVAGQQGLSSSVTVALPPARPVAAPLSAAPRLVRLSFGEVALVTTRQPIWREPPREQMAATGPVRWVPIAPPASRGSVQVLNAARSQGLAASARVILADRGWRGIAIGDAPVVRQTSVVLYPKARAALGKRLAAQFGVGARMVERDILVLILGRDSVSEIRAQRRS